MFVLLNVVAASGLLLVALFLVTGRKAVAGTTLKTAWWWAAAFTAAGFFVWLGSLWWAGSSLLVAGWYLTGVLALCPLVAVLGARRPINRAWPYFVLLPLLGVLSLPVWTTWWHGGTETPLLLESPTLVGFFIVLVMGAGNYLFTRFAFSAVLTAAGITGLILPATGWVRAETAIVSPLWGLFCIGMAALTAWKSARQKVNSPLPVERLWIRFRDTFGVVWAKRVMDRLNWSAAEEGWPLRVDLFGLQWIRENLSDEEKQRALQRFESVFGWLLQRFVNAEWGREFFFRRVSP